MRIHRNRNFRLSVWFNQANRAFTAVLTNVGSEVCLDELQAAFAGESPVLVFNPNKPYPWSHLFNMMAIMLEGKPYVICMIGKHPGFHDGRPTTQALVGYLNDRLPNWENMPIHVTADSFYCTAGVRTIFDDTRRVYTMASRGAWSPYIWRVLGNKLPQDRWAMVCDFFFFLILKFFPFPPPPPFFVPSPPPSWQIINFTFFLIYLTGNE